MPEPILAAACVAAIVTFAVHTFVGGRYAARPLLADTRLPRASKWLNYFCWHVVTVLLAILAAVLGAGALGQVHADAIRLVAVIAASISVTSVAVTLKAGIPPLRFPATYLLAIVAGLAAWGSL